MSPYCLKLWGEWENVNNWTQEKIVKTTSSIKEDEKTNYIKECNLMRK